MKPVSPHSPSSDPRRLEHLVQSTTESLEIERKSWIDFSSPEGQSKFIRTVAALHNHNGGWLLIGFDPTTHRPIPPASTFNVREQYCPDTLQSLVATHLAPKIPITVEFSPVEHFEVVVITVPSGVRVPTTVARAISTSGKDLLRDRSVFVRTLRSHRPGTDVATADDWPELIERCLENREADLGRLLLRYLPADAVILGREILGAVPALRAALEHSGSTREDAIDLPEASASQDRESRSGNELGNAGLERLERRFVELAAELNLEDKARGFLDVSLHVSPELSGHVADENFLGKALASNPHLTGWPMWIDSRGFTDIVSQPRTYRESWEAIIPPRPRLPSQDVTYWSLTPAGEFLHRRTLDDDTEEARGPQAGKYLDYVLATWRVTECIAVAIAMARALGANPESALIRGTMRWTGLRGRQLVSWSEPSRYMPEDKVCFQSEVLSPVSISLGASQVGIAGAVAQAMAPLFRAFRGLVLEQDYFDRVVSRVFDRSRR